ncbi:MAG: prepilin-type N-terminal cleavage/methylation domain-containing protein [Polyangiaceae bacterium]
MSALGPRRALARGYTAVEVTVALALLAIGASGVIALQKITLQSVTNARNIATANQIAVTWAERLRADAAMWNNPITGSDLSDTTWLKLSSPPPGAWLVPTSTSPGGSAWADIEGRDIYPGTGGLGAFCTHLRMVRIYPSLIRAEVRVFWRRSGMPVACDTDPATIGGDSDVYGIIQVATGVFNTVNPT